MKNLSVILEHPSFGPQQPETFNFFIGSSLIFILNRLEYIAPSPA